MISVARAILLRITSEYNHSSYHDRRAPVLSHIHVFKHYIPAPLFVLAAIEFALLFAALLIGNAIRFQWGGDVLWQPQLVASATVYAAVVMACTIAMGVYRSSFVDGFSAMLVRTIVAYCLLGCAAVTVVYYVLPYLFMGRGVLAISIVVSMLLVLPARWVFFKLVDVRTISASCIVLGTGKRAARLADALQERSHRGVAKVEAFLQMHENDPVLVQGNVIAYDGHLLDLSRRMGAAEVIIAVDERRASDGVVFPLDELLDCKLSGVRVSDAVTFYEREFGLLNLAEIQPGWMVFTAGFSSNTLWDFFKRAGDMLIAAVLLLLAWPLMLLTAIAIMLEDGRPVIYRQIRVGADGKPFEILKFRSMGTDAEKDGKAVWAGAGDTRVTRVGGFIRNTRIDELPQLFNVLRGEMSIVGPRPERPEFVEQLAADVPFYRERHRAKPGLMGWAQLNYPYGASVEDAAQKLSYDLYYVKNRSLLLDIIIMVQTVQIILLGTGVR